jgi:hypothetical protein
LFEERREKKEVKVKSLKKKVDVWKKLRKNMYGMLKIWEKENKKEKDKRERKKC